MAKRANPFTEDFIPQSKMHIGLKRLNNNEDRLRKVYEKTLDLLFKGAKKSFQPEVTGRCEINCNRKDKMKQLFIGNDGSLSHSGTLIKDPSAQKLCHCGGQFEQQCAYCDSALCGGCQHRCTCCEQFYCNNCLLFGSEGSEVCVSCYS